jgi:quinol monooxygenase YgiN
MQTVTAFTLRVIMPPAQRSRLLKSIAALLEPTRVQPGCLSCRLYRDYDNDNAITLIGEWSTPGDLERYLASGVRKTLIAALDLSSEVPQVQIDAIERKQGLALIAGSSV